MLLTLVALIGLARQLYIRGRRLALVLGELGSVVAVLLMVFNQSL